MAYSSLKLGYQTGKSLVILAVALFLLFGQSVLFLYEAAGIQAREEQQEAAGQILLRLREVMSDLQDAETGQRGFLLTGTEAYLEPYRSATAAIGTHMNAARVLLAGDASWRQQLDAIQ